MIVQVTAPHFCAGLIVRDEHCAEAAPILRWAVGKSATELRAYFRRKGWKAILVQENKDERTIG